MARGGSASSFKPKTSSSGPLRELRRPESLFFSVRTTAFEAVGGARKIEEEDETDLLGFGSLKSDCTLVRMAATS